MIMIGILIPTLSDAARLTVSKEIRAAWGDATYNLCGQNAVSDMCIGELVAKDCNSRAIHGHRYVDEYAMLLMMAHTITENGAYFCPTQIESPNNDKSAATTYYVPGGNNTCVWLCRDGWTGDKCNTPVADFDGACDLTPFARDNYSNVTIQHNDGSNIENQIHFFHINIDKGCTDDSDNWLLMHNEYDMALVITKWLSSGNGAYARQMMIEAHRFTGIASEVRVSYPAQSSEILVCKNGYKPNISNTDCEPIDSSACTMTIASTKMCNGWNLSGYNKDMHMLEITDGCYKYKCKNTGQAFASVTDHTCIDCATSNRGGPHPIDGTCVKCDTGYIFNKNNATNNYCAKAIGLSKLDLMYGRGKTKASYNDTKSVNDQCWTKTSPDEYKECVMNTNKNK